MPSRARPRFRIAVLGVIGALLAADYFAVIRPAQHDAPAMTTSSVTLVAAWHAPRATPDVQIAPDATPPRLLYGDEATQARERGEQIWAATIEWPFPRQWGLFTPFSRSCRFRFRGWDASTDRLYADFVAALNADPAFTTLPAWCRESMSWASGRARRVSWGYLVHDAVALVGALAFAGLGFAEARRAWRAAWARRRPGTCAACGYDITGVTGPVCPECGGVLEKAAAVPHRGPRPSRNRGSFPSD